MKKLVLSTCMCFMGLAAMDIETARNKYCPGLVYPLFPGLDWKTEHNGERAKEAARDYFSNGPFAGTSWWYNGFDAEDIKSAMQLFPDFLEWRFQNNGTILHLLAVRAGSSSGLRYVLGFSPNLNVTDDFGNKPEDYARSTFEEYKNSPWRHPEEILELRNKPAASSDSFLNSIFDKKTVGILATLFAFGLFYQHMNTKDKKPSASTD